MPGFVGPAACRGLFLVHVPKTGGGTVECSLCPRRRRYAGRRRAERILGWRGINRPASHLLLSEQRKLARGGLDGATTFAMVRDPYERFISEINATGITVAEGIRRARIATPQRDHDRFAHYRPQVDYVGKRGEKVDLLYLTSEIDTRVRSLLAAKGFRLGRRRHVSENRYRVSDLTPPQREFLRRRYTDDIALVESLRQSR